jgi:hypothetical protein
MKQTGVIPRGLGLAVKPTPTLLKVIDPDGAVISSVQEAVAVGR